MTSRSKAISRSSIETRVFGVGVDAVDHEVGLERDLALVEHSAEMPGGDRLGERTLQRRHVRDVDPIAHAPLPEVRVGEEGELQRRDRAFDRHVDDVDDQPSTVPGGQLVAQSDGAVERVEVEDAVAPLAVGHARGLIRARADVPVAMTR